MIAESGSFRITKVSANNAPVITFVGVSAEERILYKVIANSRSDCAKPFADIICDSPAMTAKASLCVSRFGFQVLKNSFKLELVQLDQTDANDAVVSLDPPEAIEFVSLSLFLRPLFFSPTLTTSSIGTSVLVELSGTFCLSRASLAAFFSAPLFWNFLLGPPRAIKERLLILDLNLVVCGLELLELIGFFVLFLTPRVALALASLFPMIDNLVI